MTPSASWDWAPTFIDAAGLPAPARMDGVSLLPELTGTGKIKDRAVYVEYFQKGTTPEYKEFSPLHRGRRRNQMQLIRTGNYVGVRYDIQSANDNFEIYDVSKDPQEIHNLAGEPGMDTLDVWMKAHVLQMRRPNVSAPRPYDNEPVPAVGEVDTEKGVLWKSYQGDFPWIPDVSALQARASGITGRPDAGVYKKDLNGVLFFTGFLRIPDDGEYTFYLSTAKGSIMKIHDATVIDADYGYTPDEVRQGTINLKAGLHPFRIYYAGNEAVKPSFSLEWSSAEITRTLVSEDIFCHTK